MLGLTTEALNLLMALEKRMRVAVEVSNEHLCQSDISSGFPQHVAAMMARMKARRYPLGPRACGEARRDFARVSAR